jgi:hypothetical protein
VAVLLRAQENMKILQKRHNTLPYFPEEYHRESGKKEIMFSVAQLFEMLPNFFEFYQNMSRYLFAFKIFIKFSNIETKDRFEAKQRLISRLDQFNLRKRNTHILPRIDYDFNCLFSAVSDQLFDTIEKAAEIRENVEMWLNTNQNFGLEDGTTLSQHLRGCR